MENAIPYCGDLHIDAGTKKLILNLLSSIRSVVPVAGPREPHGPDPQECSKSLEEIRRIILLARMNSPELEGIFNPDELMRYTRYVSDYQDLMKQMEIILAELKRCRDSALTFAGGMAEIVEDHLNLTVQTDEEQEKEPDEVKLKVV